jgi:hypothetical protein
MTLARTLDTYTQLSQWLHLHEKSSSRPPIQTHRSWPSGTDGNGCNYRPSVTIFPAPPVNNTTLSLSFSLLWSGLRRRIGNLEAASQIEFVGTATGGDDSFLKQGTCNDLMMKQEQIRILNLCWAPSWQLRTQPVHAMMICISGLVCCAKLLEELLQAAFLGDGVPLDIGG